MIRRIDRAGEQNEAYHRRDQYHRQTIPMQLRSNRAVQATQAYLVHFPARRKPLRHSLREHLPSISMRRPLCQRGKEYLLHTLLASQVAEVTNLRLSTRNSTDPRNLLPGSYLTPPRMDYGLIILPLTNGSPPAFLSATERLALPPLEMAVFPRRNAVKNNQSSPGQTTPACLSVQPRTTLGHLLSHPKAMA